MFSDVTLTLVQQLGSALRMRGITVTTAESCTGGLLAAALTAVPGSSTWFNEAFITYSNAAKTARLNVALDLLMTHGAVSEPVVAAMAQAALSLTHAGLAIAVSGIAGPDGGTPNKPVGTVCFAWATRAALGNAPQTHTATQRFLGDRAMIRMQSVDHALQQAYRVVQEAL